MILRLPIGVEISAPAGDSSHMQDFVGRGVTSKIYAKEATSENRLAPKGAGGGLAAMTPAACGLRLSRLTR